MPAGCTAKDVYDLVKKHNFLPTKSFHLIYPNGQVRSIGDCHGYKHDKSFADKKTYLPLPFFGNIAVGSSGNDLPPGCYVLQVCDMFGKPIDDF